MRLAIFGSRNLVDVDISAYIPEGVTEIISGGARGVDQLARQYARKKGIPIVEFLPKYELYGRAAPLRRNEEIAQYADRGIAFWDGASRGTEYTVGVFRRMGKEISVVMVEKGKIG